MKRRQEAAEEEERQRRQAEADAKAAAEAKIEAERRAELAARDQSDAPGSPGSNNRDEAGKSSIGRISTAHRPSRFVVFGFLNHQHPSFCHVIEQCTQPISLLTRNDHGVSFHAAYYHFQLSGLVDYYLTTNNNYASLTHHTTHNLYSHRKGHLTHRDRAACDGYRYLITRVV